MSSRLLFARVKLVAQNLTTGRSKFNLNHLHIYFKNTCIDRHFKLITTAQCYATHYLHLQQNRQ